MEEIKAAVISPKTLSLNKEDQTRLKEQRKWEDKIARESRLLSKERLNHELAMNRKFTPLNQSKAEILHLLINKGKITELLPPSNPRAKRYDSTKVCLYHSNSPDHATEECWALQHKIQNFIKNKELKIVSNIEIIIVGENAMESLIYPPEMESSDEVVVMITSIEVNKLDR